MSPYDAAIKGARELAWPVVAMTTTLVAVYLPIGFQGGLTGVLFTEFAFTLAGSVLLSGVIALTLSPMMCAKMLKPHSEGGKGKLEKWLDTRFDKLNAGYQRRLHGTLETKSVVGVFGLLVLVSCVFLYITAPKEPAPLEDEGFIFSVASADPYSPWTMWAGAPGRSPRSPRACPRCRTTSCSMAASAAAAVAPA